MVLANTSKLRNFTTDAKSNTAWLLLCALMTATAYLPALNNGFIADDYVILKRVEILKTEPLYLYQLPPENFRFVSYLIFGVLKSIAGYHASLFYAFNIGLHIANVILLWRLLVIVTRDEWVARSAALLFGIFQAHQEAVMWLAAMNETTLFFFSATTLLAWWRKRYALAAAAFSCALFSKESAVIVPLFVVLLDRHMQRRLLWRKYLWLAIPSIVFLVLFLLTVSKNFMLTSRAYAFGPNAIVVMGLNLHRLLWPWFYLIVLVTWAKTRILPRLRDIAAFAGVLALTMLPYMFIAYQRTLPSRQLYLASAVLMTLFAILLRPLKRTVLLNVVIVAFATVNIGAVWVRKDVQFQQRAAPTAELVRILRQYRPRQVIIRNFAYPLPEIAAAVGLAVPGWQPWLIWIDPNVACDGCLRLEWIPSESRYEVADSR